MNREAFNAKREELEGIIKTAQEQIKQMSRDYAAEHCQIKVGDKIQVGKQIGIVKELRFGEYNYWSVWQKLKKDGTPYVGTNELYSWEIENAVRLWNIWVI